MKGDSAEAIKRQNETLVSITIAEEKKREHARAEASAISASQSKGSLPSPKRIGRIFIVIAFISIILLSLFAYIFLLPKLTSIQIPTIPFPSFGKPSGIYTAPAISKKEPLAVAIVPVQSEKRFNISAETPTRVANTIATEQKNEIPAGSIKNLYFTEDQSGVSVPATTSHFFAFENVHMPDTLTRSLDKQFMAGFLGDSNGQTTPFIILKVSDYDSGVAGMLEGESGLPSFFDAVFGTNIGGSSVVKFKDIIVLGKNARSLETVSGTKMVYSFTNQNTIVVAGSLDALQTLVPLVSTR